MTCKICNNSDEQSLFNICFDWENNTTIAKKAWLFMVQLGMNKSDNFNISIFCSRGEFLSLKFTSDTDRISVLEVFPDLNETSKQTFLKKIFPFGSIKLRQYNKVADYKNKNALSLLMSAISQLDDGVSLDNFIPSIEFFNKGTRLVFLFGSHGGIENFFPEEAVWLKHELITNLGVPRSWVNCI